MRGAGASSGQRGHLLPNASSTAAATPSLPSDPRRHTGATDMNCKLFSLQGREPSSWRQSERGCGRRCSGRRRSSRRRRAPPLRRNAPKRPGQPTAARKARWAQGTAVYCNVAGALSRHRCVQSCVERLTGHSRGEVSAATAVVSLCRAPHCAWSAPAVSGAAEHEANSTPVATQNKTCSTAHCVGGSSPGTHRLTFGGVSPGVLLQHSDGRLGVGAAGGLCQRRAGRRRGLSLGASSNHGHQGHALVGGAVQRRQDLLLQCRRPGAVVQLRQAFSTCSRQLPAENANGICPCLGFKLSKDIGPPAVFHVLPTCAWVHAWQGRTHELPLNSSPMTHE